MSLKTNASDKVVRQITSWIFDQNIRPGEMLPSIERLAEELGVSRSTVREALQKLSTVGVVNMKQGVGTFVVSHDTSDVFQSLSSYILTKGFSVEELLEVRKHLEAISVKLAVARATNDEIQDLYSIVTAIEETVSQQDIDSYIDLDGSFHEYQERLTGNRFLQGLTKLVRELLIFASEKEHLLKKAQSETYAHRAIWEAIRNRNADQAVELTMNHIDQFDVPGHTRDLIIYCDAFGTGSVGGSFYNVGQTISHIVSRHTWIKPSVQPTGGGVDNIRLTDDKQISFGITQVDLALEAFHGRGSFTHSHRNIRAICSLRGLELQICTLKERDISGIEDLKGKKLAIGAYGGASVNVSNAVLACHGFEANKDYSPQTVPLTTAIEMLKDQTVDAIFFLSSGQSPALVDLALTHELQFLPVTPEVCGELIKQYPYWYLSGINSETYPNQTEIVTTIGVPTILITNCDVADGDIYAITKALFEQGATLEIRPPDHSLGIPYHPGAMRFFQEVRYDVE